MWGETLLIHFALRRIKVYGIKSDFAANAGAYMQNIRPFLCAFTQDGRLFFPKRKFLKGAMQRLSCGYKQRLSETAKGVALIAAQVASFVDFCYNLSGGERDSS